MAIDLAFMVPLLLRNSIGIEKTALTKCSFGFSIELMFLGDSHQTSYIKMGSNFAKIECENLCQSIFFCTLIIFQVMFSLLKEKNNIFNIIFDQNNSLEENKWIVTKIFIGWNCSVRHFRHGTTGASLKQNMTKCHIKIKLLQENPIRKIKRTFLYAKEMDWTFLWL